MSDPCGSGPGTPGAGSDCQEALAELQRYLDGELHEGELGRIKQHLTACYPCTDRASFEEQLRAIVRDGCVDAAPPALVDRIRVRLRAGDGPRG
ncbi:mycothiol system anti-sigma-R factor [Nitriliruptoraceae bacterium ZYF776]|nr:mycothiol system anti-sigma-R factor [Profundirhabdus halotolerans]